MIDVADKKPSLPISIVVTIVLATASSLSTWLYVGTEMKTTIASQEVRIVKLESSRDSQIGEIARLEAKADETSRALVDVNKKLDTVSDDVKKLLARR